MKYNLRVLVYTSKHNLMQDEVVSTIETDDPNMLVKHVITMMQIFEDQVRRTYPVRTEWRGNMIMFDDDIVAEFRLEEAKQ